MQAEVEYAQIGFGFVDEREAELLALAKAHVRESECDNGCRHRKWPRHSRGCQFDPTACARFGIAGYFVCTGYEQDAR